MRRERSSCCVPAVRTICSISSPSRSPTPAGRRWRCPPRSAEPLAEALLDTGQSPVAERDRPDEHEHPDDHEAEQVDVDRLPPAPEAAAEVELLKHQAAQLD